MQNVKPFQIAVAFTGSFLGAGFVSGQELLQFFGEFGGFGILGMLLTVGGFWLFSVLSMLIAKRANIVDFDKVIIAKREQATPRLWRYYLLFPFWCHDYYDCRLGFPVKAAF